MKGSRWFANTALALSLFIHTERFCHSQTEGFEVRKIVAQLPEKSSSPSNCSHLLQGNFRLFGSGGQSYAFISEDGKTILKCFKQHHLTEKKRRKLQESCSLAFHELKTETGLLAIHLEATEDLPPVTLIDRLGIAHKIDTNTLSFVLQKSAAPLDQTIDACLARQDTPSAEKLIDSFVEITAARYKKGIGNRDPRFQRNCGVIDGKVIAIDIGSFSKKPEIANPRTYKDAVRAELGKFHLWIHNTHPELLSYLNASIERVYEEKI
jgi:hypothetical protein